MVKSAVGPTGRVVVLLFDDIDSVFEKPYRNGLFGGLRTIIDQKAFSPAIRNVKFGFAHSHDPSHWIKDSNQSPFNVAKPFIVPEFEEKQIAWLNEQHGHCLSSTEVTELFQLLGGHPYLSRVALYYLARREITVAKLKVEAATDQGLFGDHLRSRLLSVFQAGLHTPLKEILDAGRCARELDFQSLLAMGLINGANHSNASARFGLYREYFQGKLDA